MKLNILKLTITIGLVTAGVIILFRVASLFFIYKYFKFDYYLSAVALFFLVAGVLISRYYFTRKPGIENTELLSELTFKEREILKHIIEGKSNKEIAAISFVEVSTIKTHINNIYTKLGLNNRKEAILKYRSSFYEDDITKIHPFST